MIYRAEKTNYLRQLFAYLASGWEIEEPVLSGAMWHTSSETDNSRYHIILKNRIEDKSTLLSIPSSPQFLEFVSQNEIQVKPLAHSD